MQGPNDVITLQIGPHALMTWSLGLFPFYFSYFSFWYLNMETNLHGTGTPSCGIPFQQNKDIWMPIL